MTPARWQHIKAIFQAALELAPGDRGAYVAAETAGDGELRAEIDKMLRHVDGSGLLDQPAFEGLALQGALEPGSRLGPYEILGEAGSGGMGRVYKARDARLGRIVAIKVLSAEFSHRLQIEGRAISALNHPHVCALYDIGHQDGDAYLVMEYVEGESLAARLARGALPFHDVLRYGAEIASALAAAHLEGIVHRDLKPANVMITASGAKVLDFGVAQIAQEREAPSGAVVGTVAYMSPSQLNGEPADPRDDIFALGLVLYEMIAGTRPSRPRPADFAGIPSGLAKLMDGCLRLAPKARVQRMDEVRAALEKLQSEPDARRWTPPILLGATLAIAGAIAMVVWKAPPAPAEPPKPVAVAQATVSQPSVQPPLTLVPRVVPVAMPAVVHTAPRVEPASPVLATLASYPGIERDPSLSPDGAKVAFSWINGKSINGKSINGKRGGYSIYVKPVQSGEPARLTDAGSDDWGPAWSPDGRRIAFRRQSIPPAIYSVAASGGPEKMVAEIARQNQETLPQLSWSHDGKWIASPDRDGTRGTQLYLFSVDTGEKRPLTSNSSGTDHAPAFSPDGRMLAYASCTRGVVSCDVFVMDLDRNLAPVRQRRITDEGVYLRGIAWLPDGRGLVYSAARMQGGATFLYRVSVNTPGVPDRIDMAGSQARHPTISTHGGLLAFTEMSGWKLMMIRNFQ